jgi:hypothetical protein
MRQPNPAPPANNPSPVDLIERGLGGDRSADSSNRRSTFESELVRALSPGRGGLAHAAHGGGQLIEQGINPAAA